jgi:Flp pilus assembly protein TadG
MTTALRRRVAASRRQDRDRGSIAVEVVLVAPLLVALLLFVVGLGRIAHTRGQIDGAAADAARTASLARTPAAAQLAGESAARAQLGDRSCRSLDVDIDTTRFRPGGDVVARLRCVSSLAGLGLAGFPGTRTFNATAHAPIEIYRSR